MADDIRTMKAFMQGFTLYAGAQVGSIGDGTVATIHVNNSPQTYSNFRIASTSTTAPTNGNSNDWIFDILTLVRGSNNNLPGGGTFRAYNQQRIDLTGLLQLGAAYVPMGSVSQRAGVPQLPGNWYEDMNPNTADKRASLTYMRDFTVWSVEPLTSLDLNNLWSDGIVRQSITPNMPGFVNSSGSMSTTQMLSSQTRIYVHDSGLSPRVGFMRELFAQQGGMGESAAAPHIYCTRLISGQFETTPRSTQSGGVTATGNAFDADRFWISIPPSWELLNVGIITPDDLEYLTYMQRSVQAPGGRNPE